MFDLHEQTNADNRENFPRWRANDPQDDGNRWRQNDGTDGCFLCDLGDE